MRQIVSPIYMGGGDRTVGRECLGVSVWAQISLGADTFGRRYLWAQIQISALLNFLQPVDQLPDGWMIHCKFRSHLTMCSLCVVIGPVLIIQDPVQQTIQIL